MPSSTVQARPDAPPMDYETAADVVARMLATADDVRAEVSTGQVGYLSLLLADANLLARVTGGGWARADLEEIVDRLWMVTR